MCRFVKTYTIHFKVYAAISRFQARQSVARFYAPFQLVLSLLSAICDQVLQLDVAEQVCPCKVFLRVLNASSTFDKYYGNDD